ncbi:MAG TPA: HAD-IC family P-type ATPase, partial [Dehalococcoidia bacterium]
MATAHRHAPPAQPHQHGAAVTRAFHADFACVGCAEAAARALRANPHVRSVELDYAGKTVYVTYHEDMIGADAISALISQSAHGCRCTPAGDRSAGTGGRLEARAHHADMAAVTMNTAADRMQYEFPSTRAGARHDAGYAGHTGHGQHDGRMASATAPVMEHSHREMAQHAGAAMPAMDHQAHAGHARMGHDMSDPAMAKAMEADMRNRFFVALMLTIPTVLFSSLPKNTFGIEIVGTSWANWLALVFSTPVVFWAGWPFIGGAATSLRYRQLNMSVLIATGVLAAWAFSLLITVLGEGEAFYEAAAMLVTFVLFGHWMEMKSRRGTTDALRALFDLVPPTAIVLRNGTEHELPTGELVVGDRIRLRPGAKVPVDGVLIEGSTSVDESLVTGESVPIEKQVGDPLIGGSINRAGSVMMEATKVGSETALAQIVALVQRAQSSKAPGQRLADRAAAYLVVLAVGAGLLTFVLWYVLGGTSAITALTFAISAVVIACPDALGLAT